MKVFLVFLSLICIFSVSNAIVIWRSASNGQVPSGAIRGGTMEGQPIFVCRATIGLYPLAGYVDTLLGNCNIGHRGTHHRVRSYGVATGVHGWVPNSAGVGVPRTAVTVGVTPSLLRVHVCRARHFSNTIELSGYVIYNRGRCWVGHAGFEHGHGTYSILVDPSII